MPHVAGRFLFVSLLIGVFFPSPARSQEWTRFRGPNGTGLSDAKTVPFKWEERDYNWKVELPAAGHSSPVLWGNKIFLTGADNEKTATRTVFCLNAVDGKVLWSQSHDSQVHGKHQLNSFASPTAAVDKDHAYFVWSAPEEYTLLALDHDGKEVWRRNLGPFVTKHTSGSSPIVFENLVVLSGDQEIEGGGKSFIIAVDRKTGETQWQIERQTGVMAFSTPCVYRLNEGPAELIFNSTSHGIFAVNPLNGHADWEVGKLFDKRSVSSPVVISGANHGDLILGSCGSGAGGNYLVAVHPGSVNQPDSGRLAYKVEKIAPYVPTPIAKGELLFLWSDSGIVSCLHSLSGEVIWRERVGGTFYGSPICVNDRLYCVSTDGDVVVVSASKKFELFAKNPLGEVSHSTPAVGGGRLYLRTYQHLVSIGGQ